MSHQPLAASLGEVVLHGGPAWLAARQRRMATGGAPSSAEPDRGYVEQPGERRAAPSPQLTLPAPPPPTPDPVVNTEPREEEMPATNQKKKRMRYEESFKREVVREVLADGSAGSNARVARRRGLSEPIVSMWMKSYGDEVRRESKTLVSNGAPKSLVHPGDAAAVLVDALSKYIKALVDERVDQAVQERMKRLL